MPFTVPLGEPVAPPGARAPDGRVLSGQYGRLEKLDPATHGPALWDCARAEPVDRWAYLGEVGPFDDEALFRDFLSARAAETDPFFYTVIPEGGQAQGWLSLMRQDIPNAVIETGYIWLSDRLAGTRAATEAHFLAMAHAFDDLSMRRYEWKCNALNAPSRHAAERLGFTFEGIFRQHQITRGRNRDTAWYSMLDSEWPAIKAGFEAWLNPVNFDAEGRQIARLEDLRDR